MVFQLFFVLFYLLNVLGTFEAAVFKFAADPEVRWNDFKTTYQKSYDAEEEEMRRKIFEENYRKIYEHNQGYEKGHHSFHLGCNEYADMLQEEFVAFATGLVLNSESSEPEWYIDTIPFVVPENVTLPDSVDWRNESAVTPVKTQGNCGACYAFSATGSLEGQLKLKRGELVSLSEQNIIDCLEEYDGIDNCFGGRVDFTFQYIMEDGGLDSEEFYPYEGKARRCRYDPEHSKISIIGFSKVEPRDEDTLKIAVATVGPISVGIDAGHNTFFLYKGGIYDRRECSRSQINHNVLVIGYGTEEGKDYWLVKNSWGPTWGDEGYIKMSRNKKDQCGIASEAMFPVL